MLTLEAFAEDGVSLERVSQAIKKRLKEEFHIDHATVDVMRQSSVKEG